MGKSAILVIDMIKDTFKKRKSSLAVEGLAFLPVLNRLLNKGRQAGMQVIFAMDSFLKNDYFF